MQTIPVSVVLPVYNGRGTIEAAIRSVLVEPIQEVIVVNDGSTDSTGEVVAKLEKEDGRVRHINLDRNAGLANALNVGIDISTSKFIARMDADDFSHADRFRRQYAELIRRDLDLIGGAIVGMESGHFYRVYAGVGQGVTWGDLMRSSAVFHPTWFGKASLFKTLRYRDVVPVEDLDFLFRAHALGARMGNVEDAVLDYCEVGERITSASRTPQILLGVKLRTAYTLHQDRPPDVTEIKKFLAWAKKWQIWLKPFAFGVETTRLLVLKTWKWA